MTAVRRLNAPRTSMDPETPELGHQHQHSLITTRPPVARSLRAALAVHAGEEQNDTISSFLSSMECEPLSSCGASFGQNHSCSQVGPLSSRCSSAHSIQDAASFGQNHVPSRRKVEGFAVLMTTLPVSPAYYPAACKPPAAPVTPGPRMA